MSRIDDPDRGTGLLTSNQREYLLGENDVEAGSTAERMLRSRIRDRIQNAILDFSLLATELRDDDRDQIFESSDKRYSDFNRGLADLFAFIYMGADNQSEFETLLETGITWAELRQTPEDQTVQVTVDLTINVSQTDMDEITSHVASGEFDKIPPAAALSYLQSFDAIRQFAETIGEAGEELDETFEVIAEATKDFNSDDLDLDGSDEHSSDDSASDH